MKRARFHRASRFLHFAFCGAAVLLLAGCEKERSAMVASATPIRAASAAEAVPDEDTGRGGGYSYHIRYPALAPEWRALDAALRDYATLQKKDFLAAQGGERSADAAEYQLDMTFNIARRTDDFVSVLVNGSSYTGGAHPNPLVASFVLRLSDNTLIAIGDLFADPAAALKIFSDESRRQLEGRFDAQLREQVGEGAALAPALKDMREWVARGTEPKTESFAVFLVDGLESKAIGLTLVFPPYQVAPYVDGAPQIEVPAKLFHALLKPEYVGAFHWDTEAEKPNNQH
ncbi:MAG TPA: DUF3298 domain-containing protein [Rudaea sp.]|jgi:hypothetical protein|nr:DUF3298 domain-containing protein [Rudaea sp.]